MLKILQTGASHNDMCDKLLIYFQNNHFVFLSLLVPKQQNAFDPLNEDLLCKTRVVKSFCQSYYVQFSSRCSVVLFSDLIFASQHDGVVIEVLIQMKRKNHIAFILILSSLCFICALVCESRGHLQQRMMTER